MMLRSTMIPTKRVAPSHSEWTPSPGQVDAVRFLTSTDSAALWADPGAGKTSITLAAFVELQNELWGKPVKMLVVAPLRVCQLVWRQEAQKWTQFRHLKIVLLHGPNKDAALKEDADIYLINYEGLDWLCDKYYGRQLPFDIVCCDELTKLKNHQSKRAKKLRNCTKRTLYKWGLTGTPVPNGYMDLFGQFLWLDPNILGAYITHFRDQYFKVGFTGFDYTLQAGAAERIEKRIENNVFRLEYSAMPARDIPIEIEFDKKSLAAYRAMKKDMLLELGGETITAANAAAVQQKLEQMANGAVYIRPGEPEWTLLHDLKLDALAELLEEMNGQQILIAYQFEHDLQRIQARFPDIPVLRGNEKQVQKFEDDWNAGRIQAMLVHPASVGHGLNLQKSSARHICWFSATFNLEHWDQLIRRLRRQGSDAKEIMNHILVVKGTVDELKLEVLSDKDSGQARLLQGFARILSEDNSGRADTRGARGSVPERGEAVRGRSYAGAGSPETGEVCSGDDGIGESGAAAHDALLREHPQSCGPDSHPSAHAGGATRLEPTQYNPGEDPVNTGFRRLPRQDEQQAAEAPAERPAPKGWGKPATQAQNPAPAANAEAIKSRVTRAPVQQEQEEQPEPAPVNARAAFSHGVQAQLAGDNSPEQGAPETAEQVEVAKPDPRKRAPRAATPVVQAKVAESEDPYAPRRHLTINISGDADEVKAALRHLASL